MSAILPSFSDCCETDYCEAPVTVSVPGPVGPAGPPGASASGDMVGWFVTDTLDTALLIPAASTNRFMIMLGGAAANDGFGGLFNWNNTSTALHNYDYTGGSVINPFGNPGAGRWLRYF